MLTIKRVLHEASEIQFYPFHAGYPSSLRSIGEEEISLDLLDCPSPVRLVSGRSACLPDFDSLLLVL